jgi:Putative binding domain, N-terminal/Viral BACON domain
MFRAALLLAGAVVCAVEVEAANPIQIENARPGTSEWRLVHDADARQIEGYASATSVNQGESIRFYVSTDDPTYTLNIYRTGWYGGLGARKVHGPIVRSGFRQVTPSPDPVTGLIECNWSDPYTLTIPNDWVSGAYLVKLTAPQSDVETYIPFTVREDTRASNHYFQLSVTTWQAYNRWGGKSLYPSANGAADKVSFNRPYDSGSGTGDFLWRWEYAMIRFLEREGFDVSYATNVDTHRRGELLLNHKSFLSIGHDEYWSWEMREHVEAALDAGVSLGFFSANTCYWQMRFEPSTIDGAPDRTMVSYKEDALAKDPFALDADPTNDVRVTTTFRSAPVNHPESALIGVQYIANPVDAAIVIDDVTSAPWVFDQTGLFSGSSLPGLLGYEVDAMDEFTPPGTIRLGHSPFLDRKTNTTRYSHMTLYTRGDATVFATGSIQWSWGLDDWNSGERGSRLSPAAQQMTRNLLRRFAGASANVDCQLTLSPTASAMPAAGGNATITLTTASHCAWTIASPAPWLSIVSDTHGTGSTTITYRADANSGPARATAIAIGDKTFPVQQATGCTYTFDPVSASVGAAGGEAFLTVRSSSPQCTWTATPASSWISIVSGATGSGEGTIRFAVAVNEGPSRGGAITINGARYDVQQANGCTYFVQPLSIVLGSDAASGEVAVTTNADCSWTASSSIAWVTLSSGLTGRGNGTTTYDVQPNTTGAARTGTFTVAGVTVTVRQLADDCFHEVAPMFASHTSAASSGTISVDSACAWTAVVESGTSFLSIASTTANAVTYNVAANTTGAARSGTIRVAGRAVSITQNASGFPMIALNAVATSPTEAALTWPAVAGATSYEIQRSTLGGSFGVVATTASTSFGDTMLRPQRTYLYRIRALGSSGALAWSAVDPATTIQFADAVLVRRVTTVKRIHVMQLRDAVNAMRAAALLPSVTVTPGTIVRAIDIAELRTALAHARAVIGLPPIVFGPSLTIIRASDIEELRAGVR